MFGRLSSPMTPFDMLFAELAKPDHSNEKEYPVFLDDDEKPKRKKGRYNNIFSRRDPNFCDFNANVIVHGDLQKHILLEGPAQHIQDHCERFLQVLANDWMPITDVIAAGDPLEGRKSNKGYLHYFTDKAREHLHDHEMLEKLASKFHLSCHKHKEKDNITTHIVTVENGANPREVRVHHIPNFRDFKTLTFSLVEVETLLNIFQNAETLAIHCSAGMGRTGVLELAFCLFNEYEKYFPKDLPDFAAIKLKVNELRILRPELLQTADQYRMAIILAIQLYAANRQELTEDVQIKSGETVDEAARKWQAEKTKQAEQKKPATLMVPVAQYGSKSRSASDNELSGNEVSANSLSDYSDYSEDEENSAEVAVMRH